MPVSAELNPASPESAGTGLASAVVPDQPEGERQALAASAGVKAETGGPAGPEPTRYGDWERAGRCIDF